MKYKILLYLFFLCAAGTRGYAQNKIYQIKADTVRIFNNCDTAELVLENRTRAVLNGVLTNKGDGITEFRKVMTNLGDSLYIIGGDTLNAAGLHKNIYNANGSIVTDRVIDGNGKNIQFRGNKSYLIANIKAPVVLSAQPADSLSLDLINNGPTVSYTGLVVRGSGCDAGIRLVSDSAGTCTELQNIDFATLRPRKDSWLTNIDPSRSDKTLLGRIQLETFNNIADYSALKFAIKSDTVVYKDGAYVLYTPGKAGGYTPYPVMSINPSFKHPVQGYNTKMPWVQINGGLFVGYGRNWYFNSRNAQDIIASVDDVPGYKQAFYETRFSVYADSLPLKIYKLPTLKANAFLTYSPDKTVEGNNVAFEYKDSVYEEIRTYISLHGLTTPSDAGLKENISLSQLNSNQLLGLTVRDFNYKTDFSKTRYTGLIAQELKIVLPELVLGMAGSYSIDYVKMVPYLLKAMQDQQKQIRRLQMQSAADDAQPDIRLMLQQLQEQLLKQQQEIAVLKEQLHDSLMIATVNTGTDKTCQTRKL